jgi:hypothetical protein
MTKESDAKAALAAHIKKVGIKRFNEETNFLKHADQDPEAEINEDFHVLTEAEEWRSAYTSIKPRSCPQR